MSEPAHARIERIVVHRSASRWSPEPAIEMRVAWPSAQRFPADAWTLLHGLVAGHRILAHAAGAGLAPDAAGAGIVPHAPDAAVWQLLTSFLDTAAGCPAEHLTGELAAFGLNLLRLLGWSPPPSSVRRGMTAEAALRVVDATIKEHAG